MAELRAEAAWAGLELPLVRGGAVLEAREFAGLIAVAPFRGRAEAVGAALGMSVPGPGRIAEAGGVRTVWMGLGLVFVEAAPERCGALAATLAGDAAVTDQADGWAALRLTGAAAGAVLARLVPIDLAGLGPGEVARTQLRHMMCAVLRVEGGVEVLVMRSFARSAAHEIGAAMARIAAEAEIRGDGALTARRQRL